MATMEILMTTLMMMLACTQVVAQVSTINTYLGSDGRRYYNSPLSCTRGSLFKNDPYIAKRKSYTLRQDVKCCTYVETRNDCCQDSTTNPCKCDPNITCGNLEPRIDTTTLAPTTTTAVPTTTTADPTTTTADPTTTTADPTTTTADPTTTTADPTTATADPTTTTAEPTTTTADPTTTTADPTTTTADPTTTTADPTTTTADPTTTTADPTTTTADPTTTTADPTTTTADPTTTTAEPTTTTADPTTTTADPTTTTADPTTTAADPTTTTADPTTTTADPTTTTADPTTTTAYPTTTTADPTTTTSDPTTTTADPTTTTADPTTTTADPTTTTAAPTTSTTAAPTTTVFKSLCAQPTFRILNGQRVTDDCPYSGVSNITTENGTISACNAVFTVTNVSGTVKPVFVTAKICLEIIKQMKEYNITYDIQIGVQRYPIVSPIFTLSDGPKGTGFIEFNLYYIKLLDYLGKCQKSACPYNKSTMDGLVDFTNCKALSWGSSDADTLEQNGLYEAPIALSQSNCSSIQDMGDTADAMCFRTVSGRNLICSADSGGPVYCSATSNKEWILIGVMSLHMTCDDTPEVKVLPYPG